MKKPKLRKKLLFHILSQPTAPFREMHVIRAILKELKHHQVPHFQDPIGNIVIGAKNKNDYLRLIQKKTREPLRLFIAHTDHPGFHGIKWKTPTTLEVQWHGGTPTQKLKNTKVWLANSSENLGHGKIYTAKLTPTQKSIQSAVIQISDSLISKNNQNAENIFGGFSFRSPYWTQDQLIYTKAADDLIGAFAILSLALDLKRKNVPYLGLLTRAEEVGFIGAIGHFQLNWLQKSKRPILCVSLETSRTLSGAHIGQGPVVRLGDRSTVFDSGALRIFSFLAEKTLPNKHQRRIMDGGSCEATAATVFGFPSIGISIPLGNYHNQSFEGGPDSRGHLGPAPEFVHTKDIEGLLILCHALLSKNLPWSKPWESKKEELKNIYKKYKKLL